MAVDITINETIDSVDITVNPNIIEVNVTRTSGGGGSQTLEQTLALGNQTGGENIVINDDDAIELENTSLLKKGTYNFGGDGGISRICSNNYEDMWQNGFRHVFDQSGFIRHSTNCFDIVPDSSFDVTLRFKVDSLWTLDNGTTYKCTDATEGAAVWEIYATNVPTLQQVTDEGNTTTNDIIVSKATGSSVIQVVNGDDALTFQVDSFGSLIELNDVTDAEYGSIRLGEIVMQAVDASIQLTYNYFGLSNNNSKPYIELSGSDGILTGSVSIKTDLVNGTYEQQLPSKSGTFAMLDDILDWTSVVKHTVKNNGTGLISKGTAVYVTGSDGTNMLVGKASNDSEATSSKTMGLMQSDITTTGGTQTGFVVTEGLLEGLNTASATAGDPVWLGVNGALIYGLANKPYAPAHLVFIGIVTKVSAGNGEIFIKVQNGFELKEIHDVDLVSNAPTNGQGLVYERATSLWKNKNIFEEAILRNNNFYFTPNTITIGQTSTFGYSERIGSTFVLVNNGAILRGMATFATTGTAGTLASMRQNNALQLQGYECKFTRKIQFNSNVSGQRFFCGISKGNQFSAPTNVEPSTLTDIVGVCQLSTSTNMHVVHNDASGTATTIDLGSSYPCNDSRYNYYISIEQTTTSYIVSVERVTVATGVSISTTNTLTTNIPNYATGVIQMLTFITNNATAAIASYLDGGCIGSFKN